MTNDPLELPARNLYQAIAELGPAANPSVMSHNKSRV